MKGLRKLLCFFVPLALAIAVCFGFILPLAINGELWNDSNSMTSSAEESPSNTGASTADQSLKGGAIFMQPGSSTSSFDMNGGEISNSENKYGGAIFISTGTAFTMTAGSIHDCQATYGGAIYVQAGATCTITGGSIHDCTATYGPAIFVERGAIFSCTSPDINPDEIYDCNISLRTLPYGISVKRLGVSLSQDAPLEIGDVLEITRDTVNIKNDYLFGEIGVSGASKQGNTDRYIVQKSVDISCDNDLPATSNVGFSGADAYFYRPTYTGMVIDGEAVIPNYHDGVMITSIQNINNNYAFEEINITSVRMPDTITTLGDNAFNNCRSITNLEIPEGITSIGYACFRDCRALESINLEHQPIDKIELEAFGNCTSLKSITIPETVTSIGQAAFYYDIMLETIYFNAVRCDDVTAKNCFYRVGEKTASGMNVYFGNSVERIPSRLFYYTSNGPNINVISIGENVTEVGEYAFGIILNDYIKKRNFNTLIINSRSLLQAYIDEDYERVLGLSNAIDDFNESLKILASIDNGVITSMFGYPLSTTEVIDGKQYNVYTGR